MAERRTELDELRRRLRGRERLVTLIGPGGSGKSWLADRAAADLDRVFAGGVRVAELADLNDGTLLTPVVAQAIGLQLHSSSLADRTLADAIGDQQLLLVLDGCEHVLTSCAKLVAALLRACPGLRVLSTSRQPLGVLGETVVPVPPLEFPDEADSLDPVAIGAYDAVALFVQRATAAVPTFRLTGENCGAVATLCARLAGNPLAIELAAARVTVLSPQSILARLDDRYRLLTKGSPESHARHRSLEASVAFSYDLCREHERTLWTRMSVFPGSFDLDAAEAVCSGAGVDEREVLDLVDSLLEKSVLVREDADASTVRYRLPETLRAFGADRLDDEEKRHWRHRHLEWCEALVRLGGADWFGPRQSVWVNRLEHELVNLRAALDCAAGDGIEAPRALRMLVALEPFWIASGRIDEGCHWLARALSHGTGSPEERVRALAVATWLTVLHGDPDGAAVLLAEARSRQLGVGAHGRSEVARAEGGIMLWAGRHQQAAERFYAAAELARAAGSSGAEASAWFLLGLCRLLAGQDDDSEAALGMALGLSEQAGESQLRSYALSLRAAIALRRGDAGTADRLHREALPARAEAGDRVAVALILEAMAAVAVADGDPGRAATLVGSADTLWQTLGAVPRIVQHLATGRDQRLAPVRDVMAAREFEQHFARGASMPLPAVVQFALHDVLPAQRQGDETSPLTARELEVAVLVGRGMSNRDIASALVISPRTVQGHVENILRKLGFSSRTQVAAWVAERRARASAS